MGYRENEIEKEIRREREGTREGRRSGRWKGGRARKVKRENRKREKRK